MAEEFLRRSPGSNLMLAMAFAAGSLVAAGFGVNEAQAAALALPLASTACHGEIGNSPTDPTDLPAASFNEQLAYFSSIQPPGVKKNITGLASPLKKGAANIGGVYLLTIDGACAGFTGNTSGLPPCLQTGGFTGAVDKNGVVTITFTDIPGGTIGEDPLDGCQQKFQAYPFSGNSGAFSVATTSLTQAPTIPRQPAPPTCKAVGTRMVMGCNTNAD